MAVIYQFNDFIIEEQNISADNRTDLMSVNEAKLFEQMLQKRYPNVRLNEKESQEIFAKVMRSIMRMENCKK